MFRKKLHAELGNFFYYSTGIGANVSVDEKISMQESLHEVWKYLVKSADKYCTNNTVSID